jgi:hypothetical protein
MFLILGSFALGSIALWVCFASIMRPACARQPKFARPGQADALAAGAQ